MNIQNHRVAVSMGSNIEPMLNIRKAVDLIKERYSIQAISETWETPPIGSSGPNFYNTALILSTEEPVEMIRSQLRAIEAHLLRVRTADKYAPRTIDLDTVLYDDQILEPRLWQLAYIAIPLAELVPELRHPNSNLTLRQIAADLLPNSGVIPHPEVTPSLRLQD